MTMIRAKDSIDRVLFPIKMIKKLKNLQKRKKVMKDKDQQSKIKMRTPMNNIKKQVKVKRREKGMQRTVRWIRKKRKKRVVKV